MPEVALTLASKPPSPLSKATPSSTLRHGGNRTASVRSDVDVERQASPSGREARYCGVADEKAHVERPTGLSLNTGLEKAMSGPFANALTEPGRSCESSPAWSGALTANTKKQGRFAPRESVYSGRLGRERPPLFRIKQEKEGTGMVTEQSRSGRRKEV